MGLWACTFPLDYLPNHGIILEERWRKDPDLPELKYLRGRMRSQHVNETEQEKKKLCELKCVPSALRSRLCLGSHEGWVRRREWELSVWWMRQVIIWSLLPSACQVRGAGLSSQQSYKNGTAFIYIWGKHPRIKELTSFVPNRTTNE